METEFKGFVETGQNFSKRKLKIGTFQMDCGDVNSFHINLLLLLSKELLKHFLNNIKQTSYPICLLLLSNVRVTIETHFCTLSKLAIFKANYLLTATVKLNNSYIVRIINISFANITNKKFWNIPNLRYHGNKTIKPSVN